MTTIRDASKVNSYVLRGLSPICPPSGNCLGLKSVMETVVPSINCEHEWLAVDGNHLFVCKKCGHFYCTCAPGMVSAKPLIRKWREWMKELEK